MGRLTAWRVKILGVKCNAQAVCSLYFFYGLLVISWGECYDGVIVTCYNQVTRHGRKRKGKNILLFFLLFVEEDSFLPLEQRVELRIDLAGTTTLWKNQDVT